MRKWMMLPLTCCLFFSALTTTLVIADTKNDKTVLSAAGQWLELTDAGMYAEGWSEALEYLRNAVTSEQFVQSLVAVRGPLGVVLSREMAEINYTKIMPGAPDGEYVVIRYDTSFSNKDKAVETVALMLDEDGVWKVTGYYIK